jgi:hypothetical protein
LRLFVKISIISIVIIINTGCEEQNNDVKSARVNDQYLSQNDLINNIPLNLSSQDSLLFVENYIHNWLVDQLIMNKASEMIPADVLDVEKKLEKYKMSLVSYKFEQFYVNKRLDTNINTFEIVDYYNNHLDDFVLNDYVVKCLYIKVPKNSKNLKEIKRNYHIKNEKMIDKIMSLAQKEALTFYYSPDEWIYFDELLKRIPDLEKYSKVDFIKKKKKITLEIDEEIYFINVYDFLIKDGTSPLSFEKDKIKSILLNQRANFLRKKLRQDLYEDGIKNKLIEKI